jgi:hypothetical protein
LVQHPSAGGGVRGKKAAGASRGFTVVAIHRQRDGGLAAPSRPAKQHDRLWGCEYSRKDILREIILIGRLFHRGLFLQGWACLARRAGGNLFFICCYSVEKIFLATKFTKVTKKGKTHFRLFFVISVALVVYFFVHSHPIAGRRDDDIL